MDHSVRIGRRNVVFQSLHGRQFFERQEFLALRHDLENGGATITITDTVPREEQLRLAAEQALLICAEECGHPILDDCGLEYTLHSSPIPGMPHLRKRVS